MQDVVWLLRYVRKQSEVSQGRISDVDATHCANPVCIAKRYNSETASRDLTACEQLLPDSRLAHIEIAALLTNELCAGRPEQSHCSVVTTGMLPTPRLCWRSKLYYNKSGQTQRDGCHSTASADIATVLLQWAPLQEAEGSLDSPISA